MVRTSDILVGAIETGGTKFVCAVGSGPGDRMLARASFPTGDRPAELLDTVVGWLKEQEGRHGRLRALGVASFGPVDLHPASPTYGFITSTPKPGWRSTDVVGRLRAAFADIPIGFDTDVNGAALGERAWGSASGLSDFVYITIGTGIGAGAMVRGELLHGLVHPEMGHMLLPRGPGDDFPGICPYHGGCWEGLCSGPALQARTGVPAEDLPPDHPAWGLATRYIAHAIANITCVLSPQRVILGGGVPKGGRLGEGRFFQQVREKLQAALNGYITAPALGADIDRYLVPPLLGDDAGVCGAIALGQKVAGAE
jgi:fructokinase